MPIRCSRVQVACRLAFSFLAGLAVLAIAASAPGADWPQWRGPDRNGISQESDWQAAWPAEGPKVVWKYQLGAGFSSCSVSGGRLYTMGNATGTTDTVYCLDANTGEKIWIFNYPCELLADAHEGGPSASPTVDGDSVYTVSKAGDFFCLDSRTGKERWRHQFQKDFAIPRPNWSFACSPLAVGEMVIVNPGPVMAFNKHDGKLIWRSKDYRGAYSSPVLARVGKKQCIADFNGDGFLLVALEDGQPCTPLIKWEREINIPTPIVDGDRGRIFISTGYNIGSLLLAVDDGKTTEIWRTKNMRNKLNSSVLWKGHLYGFDESELRCIDYETGDVKWGQKGLGMGSLMLAGGKLIILGEQGELVMAEADPAAYKEIARAKILDGRCWTVPVLANGRIYARNAKGDLVCVDVHGKK